MKTREAAVWRRYHAAQTPQHEQAAFFELQLMGHHDSQDYFGVGAFRCWLGAKLHRLAAHVEGRIGI